MTCYILSLKLDIKFYASGKLNFRERYMHKKPICVRDPPKHTLNYLPALYLFNLKVWYKHQARRFATFRLLLHSKCILINLFNNFSSIQSVPYISIKKNSGELLNVFRHLNSWASSVNYSLAQIIVPSYLVRVYWTSRNRPSFDNFTLF